MMLVEADGQAHAVPARAREVFDVSGAGDTVIAAMTLAHASGLSLSQSMHIANAAAGVVVSKLGTATVTVAEVLHEMEGKDGAAGDGAPGLRPLPAVLDLVARWQRQGLRVGFTSGCFDTLRSTDVALLRAARGRCDRLVVGLTDDTSVSRLHDRAQVMAAIVYVDCVVGLDDPTSLDLLRRLVPDVAATAEEHAVSSMDGVAISQAHLAEP